MNRLSSLISKFVNKETLSYLFWGIATSLLNVGLFFILDHSGVDYKIANLIALLCTKIAAYFTSKYFVFHSKCNSFTELIKEILSFVFARGATMLLSRRGRTHRPYLFLFSWRFLLRLLSM